MEVIRDRYEKGVAIFGETCTHYLTITTDALEKPGFEGAKAVCSPALRSQDHLDAMWEAVKKVQTTADLTMKHISMLVMVKARHLLTSRTELRASRTEYRLFGQKVLKRARFQERNS